MAKRKRKNNRGTAEPATPTLETIKKDFTSFIAMVNKVVSPGEGERERFPEFRVMGDLRSKIGRIPTLVKEGNLSEAHSLLEDTKQHFANAQAGYARTLVEDLDTELKMFADLPKEDADLLSQVQKRVREYTELVEGYFDLKKASDLYWKAIDTISRVEDEAQRRANNRRERAEKEQQDRQHQADKEARQRQAYREAQEQQRRQAAGSEMEELLGSL